METKQPVRWLYQRSNKKTTANMAKLIGAEGGTIESEIVPLTFGESDPLEGRYFKAKKLKSTEKGSIKGAFGLRKIQLAPL